MHDADRRGERFRHPFDPLQVGVDRLFPLFDWIYDLTAEDFFDRVQGEFERGDDAEVPATAAQTPEEIGVAVFVDLQQTSVGGNELNRAHAGGAEAILAHESAGTGGEHISGNGRHDDERWMLVKSRCIPCQTSPVVAIVSWDESTPLETCSQVLKLDRVERDMWMHRWFVLHKCFPS